jgi:regulator of replication initiation timing
MISENEMSEKEIKDLREENDKLRKELDHTKYQLGEMNSLFHDAAIDINKKSDLIDRPRETLNQVHDMIQNGCHHENILEQVEWRI